jgi:hypothetical protein
MLMVGIHAPIKRVTCRLENNNRECGLLTSFKISFARNNKSRISRNARRLDAISSVSRINSDNTCSLPEINN